MSNDYTYTGQYLGLVDGNLDIDYLDGSVWLEIPDVSILGNFPNGVKVSFMSTRKEIVDGKVDMFGEMANITYNFSDVLSTNKPQAGINDYYEIRLGEKKPIQFKQDVIEDLNILSLVLINPITNKPFGVVNLRHYIPIPSTKQLYLTLSVSLRYAMYGMKTIERGEIGSYLNPLTLIGFSTFFINASEDFTLKNQMRYMTDLAWNSFTAANPLTTKWPESLTNAAWVTPDHSNIKTQVSSYPDKNPTIDVGGFINSITEPLKVKAIMLPFVNGLALVCVFNQMSIVNDSEIKNYLPIKPNQQFNFSFETKYIGVSK